MRMIIPSKLPSLWCQLTMAIKITSKRILYKHGEQLNDRFLKVGRVQPSQTGPIVILMEFLKILMLLKSVKLLRRTLFNLTILRKVEVTIMQTVFWNLYRWSKKLRSIERLLKLNLNLRSDSLKIQMNLTMRIRSPSRQLYLQ